MTVHLYGRTRTTVRRASLPRAFACVKVHHGLHGKDSTSIICSFLYCGLEDFLTRSNNDLNLHEIGQRVILRSGCICDPRHMNLRMCASELSLCRAPRHI